VRPSSINSASAGVRNATTGVPDASASIHQTAGLRHDGRHRDTGHAPEQPLLAHTADRTEEGDTLVESRLDHRAEIFLVRRVGKHGSGQDNRQADTKAEADNREPRRKAAERGIELGPAHDGVLAAY